MNHYKFLTNSSGNSKGTGAGDFLPVWDEKQKTLPFSGKRSDDQS
jgi:hypothetical protein